MVNNTAECSPDLEELLADNEYCGLLIHPDQPDNPFSSCFLRPGIDVPNWEENCRYDVCANQEDPDVIKQAACGTLAALAAECLNAGVPVDWREVADCSGYKSCGNCRV